MFNPLSALYKRLLKPEPPPDKSMPRSIEPRLTCMEIMLARQAIKWLDKQGYRYARSARVDRIGNHCYLVFPSNEDPENSEEEILLY
jgi:hypothetical protein